jgi:predicted lipid-binding transport protein (Tim44 family)
MATKRSVRPVVAQAAASTPRTAATTRAAAATRAAATTRAGATAAPRTQATAGRHRRALGRALRGTFWGAFRSLAFGRALGGALGRRLALLLALLAGHSWEEVCKPKEKYKSHQQKYHADISILNSVRH